MPPPSGSLDLRSIVFHGFSLMLLLNSCELLSHFHLHGFIDSIFGLFYLVSGFCSVLLGRLIFVIHSICWVFFPSSINLFPLTVP